MKIRYSKTIDNLIVLTAAFMLATALVGGFNYAGGRYPWLESHEAPPAEFRTTIRTYA